jgi:hypothetical protein
MSGAHDRRSFLRELLRGATRAAGELGAMRDAAGSDLQQWESGLDFTPGVEPAPLPAAPTTRLASPDDVRALCRELDREAWADQAAALARTSFRLTPGGGDGASWLGGSPPVPPDFEWPTWDGVELTFLGQVGLAELPDNPLPRTGALQFFFALDRMPLGLRADEAGACRVVHVREEHAGRASRVHRLPEARVLISAELTLPDEPATFEVDGWALETWNDLRERLADAQGVELEELAPAYHALHRMLGHPDTFAGGMELDAELVSKGVDLDDEPYADPRIEALSAGAADWRLLFQLSSDDELGVTFGSYERLFVWIREDDLRAGRFDEVRAFVR